MAERKRRRRYPIVDRSLQYRFLAIVLVYSTTIVLFLGICLFVPDIVNMMDEELSLEVRAAAAQRMLSLHARVWPATIALVCLLGIHSVRFFHRLIGPLYRFRSACEKIREGDLGFRVRLRKKDYIHREEAAFNEMVDVFAEKWESTRKGLLDALNSLCALEQAVTEVSGWRDGDQQLLKRQREHLEGLAEHVQYFRLREREKLGQEVVDPAAQSKKFPARRTRG